MKICRFTCEKLHGYLDLNPTFNSGLTFLTGINGSGKTSVIQGISALLTPSFNLLDQWDFKRLEVEVEHKGEMHAITAHKDRAGVAITFPPNEPLPLPPPPELAEYAPHDSAVERVDRYYDSLLAKFSDHPVVTALRALPTPMILGIDRRSQETLDPTMMRRRMMRARSRSLDPFRNTLTKSLEDAVLLAEDQFRLVDSHRRRRGDRLREQMILNAFEYKHSPVLDTFVVPSQQDADTISDRLDNAIQTIRDLGIPEQKVRVPLTAFSDKLGEVRQKIPDDFVFGEPHDREVMETALWWLINKPQFDRIMCILDFVDQYVKYVAELNAPIEQYQKAMNEFLQDSGKRLEFSDRGELRVNIKGSSPQPLTGLSSGESQLVVILTHLSFNDSARSAGVFIVDEPELSLHVKWQESFVDAIRTANPALQLILATHSPSIILDRTDHCVDLTEEAKH